jgi:hypothetical protein
VAGQEQMGAGKHSFSHIETYIFLSNLVFTKYSETEFCIKNIKQEEKRAVMYGTEQ